MKKYNEILKINRLYRCENCFAIYENKIRAENCHGGNIDVFERRMKRIKSYEVKK